MINFNELITLKNIPDITNSFISQINDSDFDRKINTESWTIREHLYHICGVQKMLLERIETIKNNIDPVIEPYFPQNDNSIGSKYNSISAALTEYKTYRNQQIEIIESCSEEELRREALHKEYKKYSIPIIVTHMIFHEYWHMYRVEELFLTRDDFINNID
ncbi:MAG TPA: DinB family protein [Spirochaetota bacterium]|nr:DinB family protein [Spirochaetota bacterium]